jgi:hypothetical protein
MLIGAANARAIHAVMLLRVKVQVQKYDRKGENDPIT